MVKALTEAEIKFRVQVRPGGGGGGRGRVLAYVSYMGMCRRISGQSLNRVSLLVL